MLVIRRLLQRLHDLDDWPMQAPFWRVLPEAWLIGALILMPVFAPILGVTLRSRYQVFGLIALLAAGWAALRWRNGHHCSRWRWLLANLAASVFTPALIVNGWFILLTLLGWTDVLQQPTWSGQSVQVLAAVLTPMFFGVRLAKVLLTHWATMRRRRLIWQFTHMQLQLVVTVMALVSLAWIALLLPRPAPSNALLSAYIPTLGLLALIGGAAIIGVLPLAALMATFLARRTASRMRDLSVASKALSQGDYAARVIDDGEDEITQVAHHFNAMASGLQHSVNALETERDHVARLLRDRREMVATVSHELRTPLSTIRGHLEALQTHALPKNLSDDLAVVQSEALHLQHLIDDLFMLSRVEIGQLDLQIAPLRVGDIVEAQVQALAPLAWRSDRVEMVSQVSNHLPYILADATRLAQTLVNLLRNAQQHTPPGGIIAVTAQEQGSDLGQGVLIEVRDTGSGIPVDDLPRIWERFYRAAQHPSGAGLGLALVKELVEAMGGQVSVTSVEGTGSCFGIWLPRA